jgi:hypothetical protein
MIGRQGVFLSCAMNKASGAVTPSLGDGLMSVHFPGISCQATIMQFLRDNSQPALLKVDARGQVPERLWRYSNGY